MGWRVWNVFKSSVGGCKKKYYLFVSAESECNGKPFFKGMSLHMKKIYNNKRLWVSIWLTFFDL